MTGLDNTVGTTNEMARDIYATIRPGGGGEIIEFTSLITRAVHLVVIFQTILPGTLCCARSSTVTVGHNPAVDTEVAAMITTIAGYL